MDRTAEPKAAHKNSLQESARKAHIPALGNVVVNNLRPAMVRAWYAKTLTNKPTYRSHAYQLLHAICDTAIKDELLERNPCMIDGATATKRTREPVVPDIAAMSVIADKIEAKFRALVLISAWCGLRFGEVIELRRKDIGIGCEIITIARGVTHRSTDNPDDRCVISTPKSGKGRAVVVPPHIRDDIAQHLNTYVGAAPTRCCSCRYEADATYLIEWCVMRSGSHAPMPG